MNAKSEGAWERLGKPAPLRFGVVDRKHQIRRGGPMPLRIDPMSRSGYPGLMELGGFGRASEGCG
jgi:hypothetical protein